MSSWSMLLLAGLFEIGFALALKLSRGFTHWPAAVLAGVFMAVSLGLLTLATRQLPVGLAYAVWTGLGAVGTALVGIAWLGESASPFKLASLALIVLGILGLKLSGTET